MRISGSGISSHNVLKERLRDVPKEHLSAKYRAAFPLLRHLLVYYCVTEYGVTQGEYAEQ